MTMELPEQPTLELLLQLIERLYSEQDAKVITQIQSYLQTIQKSNQGTELANMLLSDQSLSPNCHFFGALTYTVVLSRLKGGQELEDTEPVVMLQCLLNHTAQLIQRQRASGVSNTFIVRKMFQNLSILYKFGEIEAPMWTNPIAVIAYIISTNTTPPLDAIINVNEVVQPLLSDYSANNLILTFASIIVEDLTSDFTVERKHRAFGDSTNDKVHDIIYPIIKLTIIYNLQSNDEKLIILAFDSLTNWFQYINFVLHNSQVRYNDLNDIWQCVLIILHSSSDDVFSKCVDFVTSLFDENPFLVSYDLRMSFEQMITSEWSMNSINKFMQSEDYDELNKFSMMISKYLESDELQMSMKILSHQNKPLLDFLLNLTNFPLKPVIEEEISKNMIDFWTHVVDIFIQDRDSIKSRLNNDENAIQQVIANAQTLFGELTKIYFNKIQLTVMADPEFNDNEQEFSDFRQSVGELFDSLFSEVGASLFDGLTSAIASSDDLNQIETSFFLLTNLASSMDDADNDIMASIDKIFKADFLTRVTTMIQQQHVPDAYVKYSIRFLGEIDFFYNKRPAEYAIKVIGYLFDCMKTYNNLQFHISRTIMDICDGCRYLLTESIQFLEPMLTEMITNVSVTHYTREKFAYSVACIVQAIADPTSQEEYVHHMLDIVETAAQPYLHKGSQNLLNEADLEYTCSLFNCFHEIAKGLCVPDDYYSQRTEINARNREFWTNYHGRVHEKIKSITKTFSLDIDMLAGNADITLTAIHIYKDGLIEDYGAFALPYNDVMEYAFQKLSRCNLQKSFQDILELMATLLNCGLRKKQHPTRLLSDQEVSMTIKTFVADQFNFIQQDPDFLQGSVDIFTAIVNQRIGFLLRETETMKFMVGTALPLLLSKEKFVIKSVCKFWQKLLGSYSKTSREEEQILRQLIEQEIGPILTENLMRGILDCARSDLEQYGLVMVFLVAKHQLHLKAWLIEALQRLNDERVTDGKHQLGSKDLFIQKILITRGSTRLTNDALKAFWQDSNGLHWNTA